VPADGYVFNIDTPHPNRDVDALRVFLKKALADLSSTSLDMGDLYGIMDTALDMVSGALAKSSELQAAIDNAEATHAAMRQATADEATRATAAEAALATRIAALEARTLTATTGQLTKSLTLGIGGSTTTFGITYAKPMPSADHVVFVTLDNASASLLGTVTPVLPVTNKTAFGCTVTVRNTALLTVASSVTVQVAALQLA
jgi:hypothetical protein